MSGSVDDWIVPDAAQGADDWVVPGAATPAQPPERGMGEKVMRGAGLFGRGLNDAIGGAVGAIPDAATFALRQADNLVSMLRPEGATPALPNIPLPAPGFYSEGARRALNALGRNDTAETTTERAIVGAGEGVGNAVSMFAPAGLVANAARAGGMTQGVARTMATQPVMQAVAGGLGGAVGGATENPYLGAAASLAVPLASSVARGVISPGAVRPNEETRRLIAVAKAEGIPLTPGQITGSRPMRTAESVFGTIPSTAGKQEAINDAQRIAFNRAAMRRAGETQADRATPDVVKGFLDRAGQTMQEVAARNTLKLDADAMQGVHRVAQEASRYLTKDQAGPVLKRVDDFINKIDTQNFTVDGKAFAALDSAIGKQIRNTSDGNARSALGKLQDAIRNAMDASMTGDDAALWAEARRHYANGKIIQQAMNTGSASTAAGNIPPASLSSALAQGPSRNFAMGRGDLNDLSRIGRAFIQDPVGNSGSAERIMMQSLLSGGGAGLGAAGGGMPGVAAGLLASAAGPRVAQGAYYSGPG